MASECWQRALGPRRPAGSKLDTGRLMGLSSRDFGTRGMCTWGLVGEMLEAWFWLRYVDPSLSSLAWGAWVSHTVEPWLSGGSGEHR